MTDDPPGAETHARPDTPDTKDRPERSRRGEPAPEPGMETLLEFVRDARGFDFTGYKRSTLARRIRKRMAEVGLDDWDDYRDRLETDADEFSALFNTILINVTSFFRDTEAWRLLQTETIPGILAGLGPEDEVRVWSAGCSSGEEPYSLAILLAEAMGLDQPPSRMKIYATDVDEDALRQARSGTFTEKAIERVPAALRSRYFEAGPTGYTVNPELRRRVIFGRHDITRDAPISRLDLLVCRNTLMYFNVETQSQIVDRFHFALKEDAALLLGKAEMLLADGSRFEVINMRQRIFRRLPGPSDAVLHHPHPLLESLAGPDSLALRKRQMRDHMIDAAPYAVVGLDPDGLVVAASTAARTQFGVGAHDIGRPFSDLELSYRPVEVRSVIEEAKAQRRAVRLNGVDARTGHGMEQRFFDVVVEPLGGADGQLLGVSVSYLDVTVQTMLQHEIKRVREELETAYEELQSTNEELETTNEELQSSIEELETTNEELQSTNEELETTNEELQSGNEELETMNEELRIRTGELDETRTFHENVLSSITVAVIVVDRHLHVQSWNAAAEELWGLRAPEVLGQPLFGLDFGLPLSELRPLVDEGRTKGRRTGPQRIPAVNRRGRAIQCAVSCAPLDGAFDGGVVMLMEPVVDPA